MKTYALKLSEIIPQFGGCAFDRFKIIGVPWCKKCNKTATLSFGHGNGDLPNRVGHEQAIKIVVECHGTRHCAEVPTRWLENGPAAHEIPLKDFYRIGRVVHLISLGPRQVVPTLYEASDFFSPEQK